MDGKFANAEDTLENGVVNIHKDGDISLDRNTIENLSEERYPTQVLEKEFEVSLHFSENVQDSTDIAGEWISILKDAYIRDHLEERKKRTEQGERRTTDR